jgi:hypothetical protein
LPPRKIIHKTQYILKMPPKQSTAAQGSRKAKLAEPKAVKKDKPPGNRRQGKGGTKKGQKGGRDYEESDADEEDEDTKTSFKIP